MWIIANCKNGVSSYELARAIGVTQKSAWFMLHRIRLAMQKGSITKIGGKARDMHRERRLRMKVREEDKGKTIVMGMLEGGGEVRAAVISDRRKPALHGNVREHVTAGTCLHTEEHPAYLGLAPDYAHEIINHLESYVDGKVHTNGIENFWCC